MFCWKGVFISSQSRCWPGLQSSEGKQGSASKRVHSHSRQICAGCWQETSVPQAVYCSIGLPECLCSMQLTSRRASDPSKQCGSCCVFLNHLALEVTHHHFHHVQQVTQTNPYTTGQGTTKEHKYQRGNNWGKILKTD